MTYSVGDIMFYCTIAGAVLFLATLGFVSVEEGINRRRAK